MNPEKNSESGKVYVKGKAAGKKIAGVYTIDMINHRRDAHLAKSVTIGCGDACNPYAFSERLSMPEKDIEETVEATWLIE